MGQGGRQYNPGGTVGYTRYVPSGDQVAFETDSAGTVGLRYTWGLSVDDLLGINTGATQAYTVMDRLGSVRGLMKRDGTWLMSQRFGPYGQLLDRDSSGTYPITRYQWNGRELDPETGWYHVRARYYSPNQRRFVQADPAGYDGGYNPYSWVDGRVLDAKDPTGEVMICVDFIKYVSSTREMVDGVMTPIDDYVTVRWCFAVPGGAGAGTAGEGTSSGGAGGSGAGSGSGDGSEGGMDPDPKSCNQRAGEFLLSASFDAIGVGAGAIAFKSGFMKTVYKHGMRSLAKQGKARRALGLAGTAQAYGQTATAAGLFGGTVSLIDDALGVTEFTNSETETPDDVAREWNDAAWESLPYIGSGYLLYQWASNCW